MASLTARRAKRWLGTTDWYLDLTAPSVAGSTVFAKLPLLGKEMAIGIYARDPNKRADAILITDQAIYVGEDVGWVRIAYSDIRDASILDDGKRAAEVITLELAPEGLIDLSVRGGRGRFRDAWSFLSFLLNVLRDKLETRSR